MSMNEGQDAKVVEQKPNGWSLFFVVAYLLITFSIYQSISLGTPVCSGDCSSYIGLMNKGWDVYLPTLWDMYRPWAVPVFFSLFGKYTLATAFRIVLFQSYLGYLAWILFAYSCQSLFITRMMKLLGFVAVSSLMFGQGYYHENQFLLSDSLGLSSVLSQLALCLLFSRVLRSVQDLPRAKFLICGYVGLLVLVTAIEVATRDANLLLALAGAVIALVSTWKEPRHKSAGIALGILILAVCIAQAVCTDRRVQQASEDILAGIVLPNEEMRNYFVAQGMSTELAELGARMEQQDIGNLNPDKVTENRHMIDAVGMPYNADIYYLEYLLTHPGYILDNTLKYNDLIFGQDFITDYPTGGDKPIYVSFNLPSPFILGRSSHLSVADAVPLWLQTPVIAFYALLCCFLFREKTSIMVLLPVFLAMLGASNAVLSFFGEAWQDSEMSRHAFIGSVLYRVGFVLCVLFLIEEVRRWPLWSRCRCHPGHWTSERSSAVPVEETSQLSDVEPPKVQQ